MYYQQGLCGDLKDEASIEKEFRKHIQRAFDRFKRSYAKSNTYIPDVNNKQINTYKLFYYRDKIKQLTIKKLSKKSGVSVAKIRKYEKMIYSQNNVKSYPICTYSDLKKLEETLGISIGGLSIKESDNNFELYYDYYRSNKRVNIISATNKANFKIIIFDFMFSAFHRLWCDCRHTVGVIEAVLYLHSVRSCGLSFRDTEGT